jgi:hypothetical protein
MCNKDKINRLEDEVQTTLANIELLKDMKKTAEKEYSLETEWLKQIHEKLIEERKKCACTAIRRTRRPTNLLF